MKRPLIMAGILFCLTVSLQSQALSPQVVASSGKGFLSSTNQIDFTIGEVVTSSLTSGNNYLTQGFYQPEILFTAIENAGHEITFSLYPNPTKQFVTVESGQESDMQVRVFNALGNMVQASNLFKQKITIDLQSLVSGNYILVITNAAGKPLMSYTLFKN